MKKVTRFVIWICSKFTRDEIIEIIKGLFDVLDDRNPDVKPKDDFKEKHPNYRNFHVDPNPPLAASEKSFPELDWKKLLAEYKLKNGRLPKPVNTKNPNTEVPKDSLCKVCSAPSQFLYFNDGKKRSQIKCKLCGSLSQVHPRNRLKTKWFCPYCSHALYLWKQRKIVSIYKCDNDKCPHFLSHKAKLNPSESRKITSYHVDNSRDTLPTTITMNEAIRTSKPDKKITMVTDGNPSYQAGIHFLNQSLDPKLSLKKVIGLQNLDTESKKFRPFKQLIERLNRTYKSHIRAANGFKTANGAIALTSLFVTHYNFLRPHISLNYSVPVPLPELENIPTLQAKWSKILHMSFQLPLAA